MPWGAASGTFRCQTRSNGQPHATRAWLCSKHFQMSGHLSLTATHEAEVSFSLLYRTGRRGKETKFLPHGHTS